MAAQRGNEQYHAPFSNLPPLVPGPVGAKPSSSTAFLRALREDLDQQAQNKKSTTIEYIIAVIWRSRIFNLSPGHVYLADMNGKTLTSQFPVPRGMFDMPNKTKNWKETLQDEGRFPDAIYKIPIPDINSLDYQAKIQNNKEFWTLLPHNSEQTNCTIAADKTLSAGKVPLPDKPITPNTFDDMLAELAVFHPKEGITILNYIPWDPSIKLQFKDRINIINKK